MFRRILIANRGEIALRIIRACKELDIESVVVYSEGDKGAHYLELADAAICIGPPPSRDSYLDISRIMSVADIANVDAVHPGYGFLSENSHFAEVCASHEIAFIGPRPDAIAGMGNKSAAKALAKANNVPVVPGSDGLIESEKQLRQLAGEIGFPVILKASAGGGGRGMRVAHNHAALISGFHQAQAEAETAFKDGSIYLEKFITNPRHIEIQVIGDMHGHIVHLGERDCSLQRRHQKIIEESPSPALSDAKREEMGQAACRLLAAGQYHTAGTVEFLFDANGNYYFMEVNARIQVEHPVTEMVTGIDLIKEQIRTAAGEPLSFSQDDVTLRGHAIECRINAEDPERDFAPCPGTLKEFFAPGGRGVRWDSHACAGYTIPSFYDSMIGKLIVHGRDRAEAVRIMRRALTEMKTDPIKTIIPLHLEILGEPDFLAGNVHTGWIEHWMSAEGRGRG